MILNLLGGGGSGKTTLKFFLKKEEGFYTFAPLTTREKRSGEIDEVHYRFVTLEEFKEDKSILLTRNVGKNRLYGNRKKDIVNHKSTTITTLDINGIKELERLEIPVKVVFLDISENERKRRMLSRGDFIEKVEERLGIDRFAFQEFDFQYPILKIQEGDIEEIVKKIKKFLNE
ncbi:hypothetical protein KAR28_05180 [Candidatus Parcubacteria bacterium]|nr:hypothetical protein [Candidatus Parcubacteria bacterium]